MQRMWEHHLLPEAVGETTSEGLKMTFEKKVFYRTIKGKDEWGEYKCPACNWGTTTLFRIGKTSKNEVCSSCLVALIIKKEYHIRGED